MDISGIIVAASIPSALTGFFFWLLQRKISKKDEANKAEREKREKEIDERDKQRKQYELCQLNVTFACMALAEATAKAVQRIPDAHCNGDMEAALEYARKITEDQKAFLNKQAILNINF